MVLYIGTAGSDNLVGGSGDDVFVGDPQQPGVFATLSSSAVGTLGNLSSLSPAISPDGLNFAFVSQSDNLITGDTNFDYDIYIKNISTGAISRVSTSSAGVQANGASDLPHFTPDGQKIIFTSAASNLVAGDTNGVVDLFMKDLVTGAVTRVNTDSASQQANGDTSFYDISADGTRIVFESNASNLVAGDTNGFSDIFVKNLITGEVTRISTDATGAEGNLFSRGPQFSPDGNSVVFSSYATNLTPGDTPGSDIFVKNLVTGNITKISTSATGVAGDGTSQAPIFSPDGSKIVFESASTNLLPGAPLSTNTHLYMKDLNTGVVTLLSSNSAGQDLGGTSFGGQFSIDGNSVLVTNTSVSGQSHSYVKNLMTGQLTDIAVLAGLGAGAQTFAQEFSPTGHGFTFYSYTGGIAQSYYFVKQELGSGADSFNGGAGTDTVSYQSALQSVTVNLSVSTGLSNAGDALGDTYTSIEKFLLSKFGDTFVGSSNADTVDGDLGDDVLNGGAGDDTVSGGDGNDTIIISGTNTGRDVIDGGVGTDTLDLSAFTGTVWVDYAFQGDDVWTFSGGAW